MTKIESNKVIVNNSNKNIFMFLSDFNNFKKLMPEEIINWNSTEDTCSFTIQGMTDFSLKIKEKIQFSKIVAIPNGKAPFNFELLCLLSDLKNNKTEAQLILNADMNPMYILMAKRPLQNFVNILVQKLKELE